MKDNCENSEKSPAPDDGEEKESMLREVIYGLGLITPVDGKAMRGVEEALEDTEDAWPTILYEETEPRPVVYNRAVKRLPATSFALSAKSFSGFSLAVLRFTTESAVGESPIQLDVADSLTTLLGAMGLHGVRPASSSLRFDTSPDPSKTGLALDVQYVINGRVNQTASGLSVETRFVNVRDGQCVWKIYDAVKSHDIIALENSLSVKVAENLKPYVSDELKSPSGKRPTESAQAYAKFKEARHHFNQFSEKGLSTALAQFEETIALDPTFAEAHAGAGETLLWRVLLGLVSPAEVPAEMLLRSSHYIDEALTLAPELANAHTAKGFLALLMNYAWSDATLGFMRALELDPNCASAHLGLAVIFTARKMFTEAQAEIDEALTIDPQSLILTVFKGLIHYQEQEWHAAQKQFNRAGQLHKMLPERLRRTSERIPPDTIFYGQALAYIGLGRLEDARLAARNASRTSHGHRVKLALLAYVYILLNRRDEAQKILQCITLEEQENCLPFHIALIHAGLCQKDPAHAEEHAAQAFRFLHIAVERRDYWALWLAVDPRLEVLRQDRARFDALLRNARLPPLGIL